MDSKKILSIFTVLTLFLLFSISPVLAEEATGSIEGSTGAENPVVETVVDIPEAENPVVETVVAIPDSENPVVETVVDIPDVEDPAVEPVPESPAEEAPTEIIPESSEYLDSDVLNVIVPITVSITIDPLELAGKGQIYSNIYKIENYGDTDVLLTFTDIQVTFAEDAMIEPLAQPFDERIGSERKSIFMMLDFGRSDVPPAVITDPNKEKDISIPLSTTQGDITGNSLVQLNFSGFVNEYSALHWHDSDVTITMNYTLVTVPPPVEEITPPAIEITPLVEEPTPLVEEPTPLVEEPTPLVEEPTPLVEEPTPLVEEPTPLVEEPTPLVEEPTPSTEEPAQDSPAESGATESPPESASPEADPST